MATLKDVAKLANVDVSTVSRALNNTSYVHPDTKARVYAAAKELGYHTNVIARALRQGKSRTIGVVVPRLHLTLFSEILQGVDEATRELGYSALVCMTEDNPKIEKECLTRLRNQAMDGILVAGTGKNTRLLKDLRAGGISVVQIIRQHDVTMSSVVADYEACGYEAVKYLAAKGARQIGLVNVSNEISPFRMRQDGYHRAMKELRLPEHYAISGLDINSFEYGCECASQLLDETPGLDAIMAAADIHGLAALRSCKERGLRVPEDVRVISLSGHQIGDMLETTLTSLEVPTHEIGVKAARMLIEEIEAPSCRKPSVQHLTFPNTLIEREST